jgi:hypothetical protein
LFGNLAELAEAPDLEAAGVSEDSAGPLHEAVEATEGLDELMAGAKKEVVGVAEDDAGVEVAQKVALRNALDRGLGANGHEDGGFDGAMRGVEEAGASAGVRASGEDFEAQGRQGLN